MVLCHYGDTHRPPEGLSPGDVITGADGQPWAFTGDAGDGRAATFVRHEPRTDRPGRPGPAPARLTLARLVEPAELPPLHPDRRTYSYGPDQQARRTPKDGGGKDVRPWHLTEAGRWKPGAGPDPWPLFGEADAVEALTRTPGAWVLVTEGEPCAEIARAGGAAAVSPPGHRHTPESVTACLRRLREAGAGGLVILADHDDPGQKRAAEFSQTAAAADLPVRVIPAGQVWADLPAGGSIDDAIDRGIAPALAVAQVLAVAEQLRDAEAPQEAPRKRRRQQREDDSDRRRLAPDEVLALLPERVGRLRVDVRSGDVCSERLGTLTANAISRLYLRLSSDTETWGKDATADAVAELAGADPFDPVAEYLEAITAEPLPLDEWRRLDRCLLGVDDPIAAAFLPRYLVSAVARVFEPGCGVRQSLVLIGPQHRGKTAMGRILFGSDHWVEGVRDLGKDALMRCRLAWGVELAELNGITRRADQEALKAFLTETIDTYRKPYDRAPERHPRRFLFWGTANAAPLRDLTGSTRFVCVPIPDRMLPLDWAVANRDAIWGRALEQYRAGVQWDTVSESDRVAIAERNADHQELDPWADAIGDYLERRRRTGDLPVKLPDLLRAVEVPTDRHNSQAAGRVRALAETFGWAHGRRWLPGKTARPAGFWPAEGGQGGHPGGHPSTVPPKASQEAASQGGDRGDTPFQQELKTENGTGGGEERAEGPKARSGRVSTPEGCPPCPPAQTPSAASDLGDTRRVSPWVSPGVSPPSIRAGDVVEVLIGDPLAWVNGHRVALIEGDRVRVVNVEDPTDWRVIPLDRVRRCSG